MNLILSADVTALIFHRFLKAAICEQQQQQQLSLQLQQLQNAILTNNHNNNKLGNIKESDNNENRKRNPINDNHDRILMRLKPNKRRKTHRSNCNNRTLT